MCVGLHARCSGLEREKFGASMICINCMFRGDKQQGLQALRQQRISGCECFRETTKQFSHGRMIPNCDGMARTSRFLWVGVLVLMLLCVANQYKTAIRQKLVEGQPALLREASVLAQYLDGKALDFQGSSDSCLFGKARYLGHVEFW